MRLLTFAIIFALTCTAVQAEIVRSDQTWTVSPDFKNDEARLELSGVACATGTNHCLVVNDEKKYAQFFTIDASTIVPGERIGLLPDTVDGEEMKDFDGEGAAYVDGSYYVIGSHGLTGGGKLRKSMFHLFRVPVDKTTGDPAFKSDKDAVSGEIERTNRLRETIRQQAPLAQFAEQCLQENGVSVEGLGALDGDLLVGFRAPVVDGKAFIMRVALSDLFKEAVPSARTSALQLGDNVGIRDLAGVPGGVLILAGRSSRDADDLLDRCAPPHGVDVVPSIWFWSGKDDDAPRNLGELPEIGADRKAEAVLVLGETDTSYRVLVMFDGAENGGPVEFSVGK